MSSISPSLLETPTTIDGIGIGAASTPIVHQVASAASCAFPTMQILLDAKTMKGSVEALSSVDPSNKMQLAAEITQVTSTAGLVAGHVMKDLVVINHALPHAAQFALGAAATAAGPVTAVFLGVFGTVKIFKSCKAMKFYNDLIRALQDPERGILQFLHEKLDLQEHEKELSPAEQTKRLKNKRKAFQAMVRSAQKTDQKQLLQRALAVLELQDVISGSPVQPSAAVMQEVRNLTQDIAYQSFKIGVREALSACLCATGIVGIATAVPSHGTSLAVAGGIGGVCMLTQKKMIRSAWKRTILMSDAGHAMLAGMNVDFHAKRAAYLPSESVDESSVFLAEDASDGFDFYPDAEI